MSKNVRICISTRLRNLRGTTHTIPERRWSVFFQNHMANNYFLGYVLKGQTGIAALCIGMKKPWIQGTEYYIDQFCVKPEGRTVGECRGRRRNKQRKHRQRNERRTGRSFLLSFGQDTYGKQTVFGPRRIGRRRKRAAPPA